MVTIQRFLKRNTDLQNNKHLPLLNSLFVERFSEFNPYMADNNFKTYMKWARRSPQLMGFLGLITSDMLSDQIEFTPVEKNISGRNKVLKAKAFWDANNGIEVAEETIYDLLITGVAYNWIGILTETQIKEFCDVAVRELYPQLELKEMEYKAEQMTEIITQKKREELAKKLRHVASSTMVMNTDEYEVKKYIQRVGVNSVEYSPREIIPFKLMPLDGKVYPYPPMEAILSEIYLLWLISKNYISYFENGGKPDSVFILPKEIAGSKNHKYLINTLTKYKKIQNKHGNMVFTGDLNIEKLMDIEQQMEHKDLGLYLVGVLAMMYGIPVSRIPFLVGKSATGGDAGGLADSGYWRRISVWQSKLEAAYNSQLWEPFFGVRMKFRRGYLQDEVRETQNKMQMASVATSLINAGLWTPEAAGDYLDIDIEVIEEAQKQKEERDTKMEDMARTNLEKDGNVMNEQDKITKNKKKQDTQNNNKAKAGDKGVKP